MQVLEDQELLAGLAGMSRHSNAQVRRCVIECFVTLQRSLGNEVTKKLETVLDTTQLKLVEIFAASSSQRFYATSAYL